MYPLEDNMTNSPFIVDDLNSDEGCFYIDIPSAAASVQIKLTHEGIIINIYQSLYFGDSVASCTATFDEILNDPLSTGE